MPIEKIYLIPHFHFDFEWWKEEPYHEEDTLIIIDKALLMLETHPEFTYVIDSVLPLKKYIENRPEGIEKLKHFVAQKRIEIVGGDIIAPDEVLPTGEALIRQFEEGQKWMQENFGFTCNIAWEIDEFAHPARMPGILSQIGFKYLVFARGVKPFDKLHPTLFNWHDTTAKSQLTTYWWAAHYECCIPKNTDSERAREKQIKDFFTEMESRIEFEAERSPVPFLMMPMGGDFVIPNPVWIDFVNQWNDTKDIQLEFSTPSAYFRAVENHKIPDYTGLFPHVFDGYFTSREKGKQACRENANSLFQLEKLQSLAAIQGFKPQTAALKKAWWEVLKGDFHDTIAGTGTDRVYRKNMQRYANAQAIQENLVEEVFAFLNKETEESNHYVFNSLNWTRAELTEHNGSEILITTPPLSFQKIKETTDIEDAILVSAQSVETKYLKVELEENGSISVFDKDKNFSPIKNGTNRTVISDDVGNLWVTRSFGRSYPVKLKSYRIEKNSLFSATIHITEENKQATIQKELTIYAHSKRIDFKTGIHYRGKAQRIDVQFPFSFEGKWVTENIFHNESVSDGIYPVQNFAMYQSSEYKAAIINKGIPGYSLANNTGTLMLMRSVSVFSWMLIAWIFKNSIPIIKHLKEASRYLFKKLNIVEFPIYPIHNLFLRTFASEGNTLGHGALDHKNHREVRFNFYKQSEAWERGNHSFDYALLLDPKDTAEVVRSGYEFNNPLIIKTLKNENADLQLIKNDVKNVIITTVRLHKNGYRIRIYEPQGKQSFLHLIFAVKVRRILRINGLDETHDEFPATNNTFEYTMMPFEIVEIYIEVL